MYEKWLTINTKANTSPMKIMVVTGRLMSDYYFYYILVSLFVVTVGLVCIRTVAENHHISKYLTDDEDLFL